MADEVFLDRRRLAYDDAGCGAPAWQVTATFGGGEATGTAVTTVRMTNFGMTPPRVGPVVSIEDDAQLEIECRATAGGAPTAFLPSSPAR